VAVYVALLRGINVGGSTKLPMAELREIVTGAGFGDVDTYIQSGNVVFSAGGRRFPDAVADQLQSAIAKRVSFKPQVVVRTRSQLRRLVDGNPFLARGEDEDVQHVACFPSSVKPKVDLDLATYAPEEAQVRGNEVYFHLPLGVGRSKLAGDLARRHRANGTMRNWRTITKLLAMADER
jgi:uncharacterized protein (DUF1697 family)